MDVKEAVTLAKRYVADLFQDEKPVNIGLEEVEFDEMAKCWLVTIGFSRPWNRPTSGTYSALLEIADPLASRPMTRDFKVVTINDVTEKVISVKKHE